LVQDENAANDFGNTLSSKLRADMFKKYRNTHDIVYSLLGECNMGSLIPSLVSVVY